VISRRRDLALRLPFVGRIFRASISSERELVSYVATTTAACVAIALAVDVANQLTFFVDWPTCFRSWAITVALVLGLAAPVSRAIGKANLELYRAKAIADAIGRTDQLTGLPNRRAFMEAAAGVERPEAVALVIVDIDRFKRVNDSFGHLAGDAVIQTVGQAIATQLGELGPVARVGGEEFAVLSWGAHPEVLAARLTALREQLASTPVVTAKSAVRVTISAGVAMRRDGETFEQLYSEADRALYAAKTAGRDRIQFSRMEDALRAGLDGGESSGDPVSRRA
jgi:diguanylate cyclase (GGDEF)-like protein